MGVRIPLPAPKFKVQSVYDVSHRYTSSTLIPLSLRGAAWQSSKLCCRECDTTFALCTLIKTLAPFFKNLLNLTQVG